MSPAPPSPNSTSSTPEESSVSTDPTSTNTATAAPENLPVKTLATDTAGGASHTILGYFKFFINWIVIPLVIVYLFQAFVVQAFYVSGQSMEPTFQNGDYLIISKIAVTTKDIRHFYNKQTTVHYQRGDVLVFRPPIATSTFYIKRLIGLPGERVVIKSGIVTIYNHDHPDGFVLHEPYIDQSVVTMGDIDQTVDADKLFMLGDNRTPNASYDSRDWGQLPQDNITGRVVLRLLPLSHFRSISRITYALLKYPLRDGLQLFG